MATKLTVSLFRGLLILTVVTLVIPLYFTEQRLFNSARKSPSKDNERTRALFRAQVKPRGNHLGSSTKKSSASSRSASQRKQIEAKSTPSKIKTGKVDQLKPLGVSSKTVSGQLPVPTRMSARALKEKSRKLNYDQSCRYLKTSKGLQRICINRSSTKGSRGRFTDKAAVAHNPTEMPYQEDDYDDMTTVPPEDAESSQAHKDKVPKIKTALVRYRHRGVVAKEPLKVEPPTTRGILDREPWVSRVDSHDYKYRANPSVDACMDRQRLDLLVLVTSHPDHVERRDAIRATWGAYRARNYISPVVTVLFLLGVRTLGDGVDKQLQREVEKRGDIIIEEFMDSYLNLSVKTVMGLKWASRYCPGARYVMKTDDDITINTPRLLAYLHTAPRRAFIGGRLAKNYPVLRQRWEKFYVPKEIYHKDFYPNYCVGLGYIMSMDIVHRLYLQSLLTTLFPWEDVFVGIMLKDIGIIPKNINNFYYYKGSTIFEGEVIVDQTKTLFKLGSFYTVDGLTPKQTRILWRRWQSDD